MININTDIPLNEDGQNKYIKFYILDDKTMKAHGFCYSHGRWSCSINLQNDITLFISIFDDLSGKIDVIDDSFMQPYDFQMMIIRNGDKAPKVAFDVQNKVYDVMKELSDYGIISAWTVGDYI